MDLLLRNRDSICFVSWSSDVFPSFTLHGTFWPLFSNLWFVLEIGNSLWFLTVPLNSSFPHQVELLIPQLQFLDDEGAQAELWELSRVFVDTLIEETGCQVSINEPFLVFEIKFHAANVINVRREISMHE